MDFDALGVANLHIKSVVLYFLMARSAHFPSHHLVELDFLSKRCRNDQSGTCTMCDYGVAE